MSTTTRPQCTAVTRSNQRCTRRSTADCPNFCSQHARGAAKQWEAVALEAPLAAVKRALGDETPEKVLKAPRRQGPQGPGLIVSLAGKPTESLQICTSKLEMMRDLRDSEPLKTIAGAFPCFAGHVCSFLYSVNTRSSLDPSTGRLHKRVEVDESVRRWLTCSASLSNILVVGIKDWRDHVVNPAEHRLYMSMVHCVERTFPKAYRASRLIQVQSTDEAAKQEVLRQLSAALSAEIL